MGFTGTASFWPSACWRPGAVHEAGQARYGLTEDNVLDMVLWAVPSCIIGARLYYVIFYLDLYRNADGNA